MKWSFAPQCLVALVVSAIVTNVAFGDDPKSTKATFLITGLHCPPCTKTVESSLRKANGIRSVRVDWKSKNAHVEFDESVISAQAISQSVAGTAHMMGGGMRYGAWLALKIPSWKDSTASEVQAALENMDGVKKIVPYPAQRAVGIQFAAGHDLTTARLIDTLKQAGIEASNL